jgi:hypothetical protein
MRPNVVQLRQFYSSRLGRVVKQQLRKRVLAHWPESHRETIVGIGYAPPLLRVLERAGDETATLALMPAEQGAIYWPVHTNNRSILGDEMTPPFAPNTLHRVLMLHAMEFAAKPAELLAVYWEMLAPGGRLLIITPNRFGLWARMGRTPFTRGRAFSIQELKDLLEGARFTLRDSGTALFAPPRSRRLPFTRLVEWLANAIIPGIGGVLIVEAEKQIYAGLGIPVIEAKRARWVEPAGAVPVTERRF